MLENLFRLTTVDLVRTERPLIIEVEGSIEVGDRRVDVAGRHSPRTIRFL